MSEENEAKWYVAHTYSGYEKKVKANIDKAIENRHLEDQILEVRVPMQEVFEVKNGVQKQTMKKLFQILNEIYEDGTNDTQSLIAVTILGELDNDQVLLARCVDYMSETMAPPVIEVNKFLATSKGKKAQEKMENPPPYKPKKKKKKQGFLSQMLSGGGGMAPPAI